MDIDFLDGFAYEEILISFPGIQDSFHTTLVCDGRMETSGVPNVHQTYPRTMIPVLRKLLTKPESEKREGGWAQAIFVA